MVPTGLSSEASISFNHPPEQTYHPTKHFYSEIRCQRTTTQKARAEKIQARHSHYAGFLDICAMENAAHDCVAAIAAAHTVTSPNSWFKSHTGPMAF